MIIEKTVNGVLRWLNLGNAEPKPSSHVLLSPPSLFSFSRAQTISSSHPSLASSLWDEITRTFKIYAISGVLSSPHSSPSTLRHDSIGTLSIQFGETIGHFCFFDFLETAGIYLSPCLTCLDFSILPSFSNFCGLFRKKKGCQPKRIEAILADFRTL